MAKGFLLRYITIKRIKNWAFWAIDGFVILAILFCFCWPYSVEGGSMLPTVSDGDRVVECRFAVWAGVIRRGDILVIKNPFEDGRRILKRVVALPGDDVVITGGVLYINGAKAQEPYLEGAATKGEKAVTLKAGEYYCLGDNRGESADSRLFGAVNKKDIIGRMYLRFLPVWKIKVY